jgi:hypothetical protein
MTMEAKDRDDDGIESSDGAKGSRGRHVTVMRSGERIRGLLPVWPIVAPIRDIWSEGVGSK